MKKLSVEKRDSVLQLLESGMSLCEIAKRASVGRVTIDNIRKEIIPDTKMSANGRPRKLSAQDKHRIVRLVTSGKAGTAAQASRELKAVTSVKASSDIVRCALKEAGMKAADAASTETSSPNLPTICRPTGSPSSDMPQGTLAAGWPMRLMGNVNGRKPQKGSTDRPAIV